MFKERTSRDKEMVAVMFSSLKKKRLPWYNDEQIELLKNEVLRMQNSETTEELHSVVGEIEKNLKQAGFKKNALASIMRDIESTIEMLRKK